MYNCTGRSLHGVTIFLILTLLQSIACGRSASPNILVILSDDLGYSDIGCYGGEIPTPNLDDLARGGVRFTRFTNTGRCCPSRAALLTGLYSHQAGIGHMLEPTSRSGYTDRLSSDSVTIAEVLKGVGYQSYIAGKWHVGANALPLDRGFDRFYGTVNGGANYYDPALLVRDRTFITAATDSEYKPENYYYTDAITHHSISFLKEHEKQSPDKPFFLYVAYTAPHWPIQAPAAEIAKHKGRYDAGYEAIRKARLEKMKSLGLVRPDLKLSETVGNWDDVADKKWEAGIMEVYAAMISQMDTGIGSIIKTLKDQGKLDNTIVMFMSDNGSCAEWKGRREGMQQESPHSAGLTDAKLMYGKNWANVSSTPFRKYKAFTHEGGVATPLIVHWPAGIASDLKNQLVHEPGHVIDIMATVANAAGTTYPENYMGRKIAPLAGINLLPLFQKKEICRQEPLFWEHNRNRAVLDGSWKLVKEGAKPWELYNMDVDRTELNNLAEQHPERVKQLADKWNQWATQNDVLPLGGWRKN